MKKRLAIFIFNCFLSGIMCFAQSFEDPNFTIKQIRKIGDNAYRKGDIYTAIAQYEKYCAAKPKDINALYQLAELYRQSRDYVPAGEAYAKVFKEAPGKYPLALYYHSLMLMNQGDYEKALEGFVKFKSKYRGDNSDSYYKKLAQANIEGATKARRVIDSLIDISITHLNSSINKGSIEFSPYPTGTRDFIFASLRIDSNEYFYISQYNDTNRKPPVRQLYTGVKIDTTWEFKSVFSDNINSPTEHTGNVVISEDAQRMYFTRCAKNWQDKVICNLYRSLKYEDGAWGEPEKLPYPVNIDNYTSTQPALGTNSKNNNEIVYFVSDRPEGKGNLDIWYVEFNKKKNEFMEPRNAGSKLNTIGDDITPYYDLSTRTLYFSSDGYPGLGGFDIFKSTGELRNWFPVENIGYPFNSNVDDTYFVKGLKRDDGFFVSNREDAYTFRNKNCCDDIYYYKWNEFIYLGITGKVYDMPDNFILKLLNEKLGLGLTLNEKNEYLENIPVQLYLIDTKTKRDILIRTDTTKSDGSFYFDVEANKDYYVQVSNYGYFDKKLNFTTKGKKDSDTSTLHDIGINFIPNTPLQFNIYYEFDKAILTDASRKLLDTSLVVILNELPQIIVEISSHTDSVGNDDYNLNLSQKRAESVVNYLISKGIKSERLIAKGYGESMPIAPNTNIDGTDNPEGRAKNRRSEIRIVGTLRDMYDRTPDKEDESE